jgi:hypothetical protein
MMRKSTGKNMKLKTFFLKFGVHNQVRRPAVYNIRNEILIRIQINKPIKVLCPETLVKVFASKY